MTLRARLARPTCWGSALLLALALTSTGTCCGSGLILVAVGRDEHDRLIPLDRDQLEQLRDEWEYDILIPPADRRRGIFFMWHVTTNHSISIYKVPCGSRVTNVDGNWDSLRELAATALEIQYKKFEFAALVRQGDGVKVQILWVSLFLDVMMLGTVVVSTVGFIVFCKRQLDRIPSSFRPPHCCSQCGYDCRGLRSNQCPECGVVFEERPIGPV